jgi:hypothetical protein
MSSDWFGGPERLRNEPGARLDLNVPAALSIYTDTVESGARLNSLVSSD